MKMQIKFDKNKKYFNILFISIKKEIKFQIIKNKLNVIIKHFRNPKTIFKNK